MYPSQQIVCSVHVLQSLHCKYIYIYVHIHDSEYECNQGSSKIVYYYKNYYNLLLFVKTWTLYDPVDGA